MTGRNEAEEPILVALKASPCLFHPMPDRLFVESPERLLVGGIRR